VGFLTPIYLALHAAEISSARDPSWRHNTRWGCEPREIVVIRLLLSLIDLDWFLPYDRTTLALIFGPVFLRESYRV